MKNVTSAVKQPDKWDWIDVLLLAVSLICAAVYLATGAPRPFPGNAIVKSLAVSPLALVVIRRLRNRDGLLLGAALLLSAIGDLILGIGPARLFVFGLGAFLFVHLLYIALFMASRNPSGPGAARLLIAPLPAVYASAMLVWLVPALGNFRILVPVYICVITAMSVMSLMAGFRTWWVPAGAMLFMLSDSLIAVNKFKYPIRYDNYIIWCAYYVGQCCIALGFLNERTPRRYRERPRSSEP